MKNLVLIALVIFSYQSAVMAQIYDISEYAPFSTPNSSNPANTGLFVGEGQNRFLRIQSNSQLLVNQDYQEYGAFLTALNVDYQLPVFAKDNIGLGVDYKHINSYSQSYPSTYSNQYNIRGSYQKTLGEQGREKTTNILSAGIHAGVAQVIYGNNKYWYYTQKHGISWSHIKPRNKQVYQLGLSHEMQIVLNNLPSPLNTQHWIGVQAYGEWQLARTFRLSVAANYQFRLQGLISVNSSNKLGTTAALAYQLRGKRQLIAGGGLEYVDYELSNNNDLTYTALLGYEVYSFRIMAYFSALDHIDRFSNNTTTPYQFGLNLAYHFSPPAKISGTLIF